MTIADWRTEIDKLDNLTLKDLENEKAYPYQLNFIRIAQSAKGAIAAEKLCFEDSRLG